MNADQKHLQHIHTDLRLMTRIAERAFDNLIACEMASSEEARVQARKALMLSINGMKTTLRAIREEALLLTGDDDSPPHTDMLMNLIGAAVRIKDHAWIRETTVSNLATERTISSEWDGKIVGIARFNHVIVADGDGKTWAVHKNDLTLTLLDQDEKDKQQ